MLFVVSGKVQLLPCRYQILLLYLVQLAVTECVRTCKDFLNLDINIEPGFIFTDRTDAIFLDPGALPKFTASS